MRTCNLNKKLNSANSRKCVIKLSVSVSVSVITKHRISITSKFKQVVNLSGTCFNFELEQFLAWFRVARFCQRQLGILVRHYVRGLVGNYYRNVALTLQPRQTC